MQKRQIRFQSQQVYACDGDYHNASLHRRVYGLPHDSTAGTLTVVVGDYERVYKKIENVKDANDRLIQLMLECREKGNDVYG